MENLYALPRLKELKGRHEVSCLSPLGAQLWVGELDDSKYNIIIGCYNHTVKIKIAETEFDCLYKSEVQDIAKINKAYGPNTPLYYLTVPPGNCEIKLILDLLEWKYNDDDIWC